MYKIDFNPIYEKNIKKESQLTTEQIELLDSDEWRLRHDNIYCIKRTRREKKTGDVFLCSINGKVFYYGIILDSNIKNDEDTWVNGCLLVCIFREKTTEINLDSFHGDADNILVEPCIVTSQYWSSGWFYTIGNVDITNKYLDLDYGFYSQDYNGKTGAFYKENYEMMDHIPKHMNIYGVTCLSEIYRLIWLETLIDPSLLKKE